MKYLYKTGIVVESDVKLDSAMFKPIGEKKELPDPPKKKTAVKNQARKQTSSVKKQVT